MLGIYFLIIISILDIIFIKNSNFLLQGLGSNLKYFYFIFDILYLLVQFFLLVFIFKNQMFKRTDKISKILKLFVIGVQIVTATIIILTLYEIFTFSHYHTILIAISIGMSYSSSIFILGIIVRKLFLWYNINKMNRISFIYAISTISLLCNFLLSMWFFESIASEASSIVPTWIGPNFIYISPGSIQNILYYLQFVTMIISFILMWLSTTKTLFQFIIRGHKHLLIIIIIPLLFFIIQYVFIINPLLLLNIISTIFPDKNVYVLIFSMSKPIGGLFFGIIFLILSNKIPKHFNLHNYLILCCSGLLLLFVTNQAPLLTMFLYPPFGLVSISSLCVSSYFFYIGIYFSVISISENKELRNIIKKIASNYKIRFLEEISASNILEEIEKEVIRNVKNIEKNKKEFISVNESEIKQYIEQILSDFKK